MDLVLAGYTFAIVQVKRKRLMKKYVNCWVSPMDMLF